MKNNEKTVSEPAMKKQGFLDFLFSRNRAPLLFCVAMFFSWYLFFFYSIIQGDSYYRIILFGSGEDTFMDFYNSCRDASRGMECYTLRGVIYPPLANLFYIVCCPFITDKYLNTSFINNHKIMTTPSNIMVCVMITLVIVCFLVMLYSSVLKGNKYYKIIVTMLFIINYPVVYAIERGNIILLAFLLVLFFVFNYDSENKYISEFACICLAISAAIKIYPALFGIMLILSKRYKQAIRTVVYGILLFFLPFGFYHWTVGIKAWIANIIEFSAYHASINNYAGVTSIKTAIYFTFYRIVGVIWLSNWLDWLFLGFLFALLLFAVFMLKEKYQKYIAMFILMDLLPGAGGSYSFIFLLIPIIYMFNSKKIRAYDYLYLLVMLAEFMPNALPIKFQLGYFSVNYAIEGLVILALFGLLMLDLIYCLYIKFGKKSGKKVVATALSVLVAITFIGSFCPSNEVYADTMEDSSSETEKEYDDDLPFSTVFIVEGTEYIIGEAPDEEIPYGFERDEFVIRNQKFHVLKRPVNCLHGGAVYVFYADDGSGYKLYTYNVSYETFEPYLALVCNGIEYTVMEAKPYSFTKKMDIYQIIPYNINGTEVLLAAWNNGVDPSTHDEKTHYLICLLGEDNMPGYYSFEMLDGFNANIEFFDKSGIYPTPYPATIANHTLAKPLNGSAEKITLISMVVLFVPIAVIMLAVLYLMYLHEKRNK